MKATTLLSIVLLIITPSCVLIPPPKNEHKHLKGKVVRLKVPGSLYESNSITTFKKEPYVIEWAHQFPHIKSIYLPAGTEMHVDRFRHLRIPTFDGWYAAGRVYVNGKEYRCANGLHHSYLELK